MSNCNTISKFQIFILPKITKVLQPFTAVDKVKKRITANFSHAVSKHILKGLIGSTNCIMIVIYCIYILCNIL